MAYTPKPTTRELFVEHHKKFSENDLMIELLWKMHLNNKELLTNNNKLKMNYNMLDRIRSNTSTMIWFLIVLPIVFGILILGLGTLA